MIFVSFISDGDAYYCSDVNGILYDKNTTSLICYLIGNQIVTIEILNAVTSIKEYAFYRCSPLQIITFQSSVISIESYAFASCSALEKVTIGECVKTIGNE